ncbi:MAG: MFS transporter [Verrucomicrobia bacterium]|nr:MFS transporter [Verrucomicrobiota bacterium]
MLLPDRTRLTYRLELQRAVANGVLEAAGSTFLLLIAVRHFSAGATAKALVASGGSVGLLLTPLVVSQVARLRWPAALAASRLAAAGAVMFAVMALTPFLPVFVAGSVVTMAAAAGAVPLMTQIYQENYPEAQRGRLFSHAVMVRIGTVAVFSELAGRLLAGEMGRYRWLLGVFALAFAFASVRLRRYPSTPLSDAGGSHPFRAMRFARDDRIFRHTLICWMLMGFANLMMLPLRVEYLASPRHGLTLPVHDIALLTGVIPNLARLLMSQVWGHLFDRMNFFALRVTLNAGFAAGILTFFLSDSWTGLVIGAIIFGVSSAGGDVAWGLWVTKFAPPEHVADYMSVHTFFTGVRGVVAPLVAFHLIRHVSLATMGWISAALIVLASVLLLPELRFGQSRRRPAPVTTEVAD